MATPGEKLAASLEVLRNIQVQGVIGIKSANINRVHRERLLKHGFLKEVVKGWYIAIPSDEQSGESTSWYTSFWSFCAAYLNNRFTDSYCLSADQSLQIHSGNWTVPNQLLIRSLDGPNGKTQLPFNTSLFTIKSPLPKSAEITKINGIRLLTLPSVLLHCTPLMYTNSSTDMRTALAMIRDSSEVLKLLLDGGNSVIAGRLSGAFRDIGKGKIADDIIKTMQAAGYNVREINPFEGQSPPLFYTKAVSPYVNRISLMWHEMREVVIDVFPQAPGLPGDHEKYLKSIESLYVMDAYHSLSIEKYNVTPELIERVRSGAWDVKKNKEDLTHLNAMAARGYWQATQSVRESIQRILNKENPGKVFDHDLGDWYRALFTPGVAAGIFKPSDLAGYRNNQIYISQSKHVPPNVEAVRDCMPALFELLIRESEASVRAVLGHFIFVYIHPYMDGNGRIARFLMNAMLASGGYPWTVVPVESRNTYMEALEIASTRQEIKPFATFLAFLTQAGLNGTPVASLV